MTKRRKDFIWNLLGSIFFAGIFPVLTVVISRILDAEQSGIFSIAFVTAQLMMIIGNYSVRIYQVSDIQEQYSSKEYYIHRYTTCALMLVVSIFFVCIKGYMGRIFLLNLMLCLYKMIDALADVFEGRLQQMDFLDKAGKSLFFRTFLSLIFFVITLLLFKNMYLSTISMLLVSIVVLIKMAVIPACKLSSENKNSSLTHIIDLYKQCCPLFISLFLFTYIINSPKYEIENVLPYVYQTYFNAIYFPAQVIFLLSNFIFKPLIITMTNYWNEKEKHSMLHALIIKMFGLIFGLVIVSSVFIYIFGIFILGWLYKIDLSSYREMAVVMIMNGGIIAGINFMYFVLTIMRKQKLLMLTYISGFIFAMCILREFVLRWQMWGAILAYTLVLLIIQGILLLIYIRETK